MAAAIAEEKCRPSTLVVEVMQVDRRTRGKEESLFALSGVVGAVVTLFPKAEVVSYRPSQWKGQAPKSVSKDRIKRRLTQKELLSVDRKATHDAWDAIGIGAYYLATQGHERWRKRR